MEYLWLITIERSFLSSSFMPCSGWSVWISTLIFGHMSKTSRCCLHTTSVMFNLQSECWEVIRCLCLAFQLPLWSLNANQCAPNFKLLSSVLWSWVNRISGHTAHLDHSEIFYATNIPLHGELSHWLKHLQICCKFLSLLLSDSAKILCPEGQQTRLHKICCHTILTNVLQLFLNFNNQPGTERAPWGWSIGPKHVGDFSVLVNKLKIYKVYVHLLVLLTNLIIT
jgi:hypothetical protein